MNFFSSQTISNASPKLFVYEYLAPMPRPKPRGSNSRRSDLVTRRTMHAHDHNQLTGQAQADGIDGTAAHPSANMCTSELLDSGLLEEGFLPALRDAWRRQVRRVEQQQQRRRQIYLHTLPHCAGRRGLRNHE